MKSIILKSEGHSENQILYLTVLPSRSFFDVSFCSLFSAESDGGLRQRNRGQQEDEDLDTVLQHHNKIQEQLANEMLVLARNLKDNAQSANRIIKDDTKVSLHKFFFSLNCETHDISSPGIGVIKLKKNCSLICCIDH